MKKLLNKKITYIFYIFAVLILIGCLSIYVLFEKTSDEINQNNLLSNIEYIDNIATNMSELVQTSTNNHIYETLKKSKSLRINLQKSLKLFVTKRYRYVYVVDKEYSNSKDFRFLLDGSQDNKAEFLESYTPLKIKKWQEVYSTKKALYFQNKDVESLWMTYLKPIVIDDKVQAVIAIDFSLTDYNVVVEVLRKFSISFIGIMVFSVFLLFVIAFFSYVDEKRIQKLKEQSQEINQFNKTLQQRVKEEVEKNRQKDQQLLQQSRLAQMGEMISMIAHQWRQPLSAINSTAIAINFKAQLNQLDAQEMIELSDKISSFSQHLSTTINDFGSFFKSNKEKDNVTYNEIITSVLGIIEVSLKNNNITLIKELNSKVVFHTYANELKQVILNLIQNANDILLEREVANATIIIKTESNRLSISDNGGGISDKIIDKIFDPYFSTKKEKNGKGLGLYIGKMIIQDHCDGELSVKNIGDGTQFTIQLPSNSSSELSLES